MTVLSVGYPLFPVSANAAGGAEQILASLDRELVHRRHRSVVLAAQGSAVAGRLWPTEKPSRCVSDDDRSRAHVEYLEALQKIIRREQIDIIHFHGLDFHAYVPQTAIPMLATLHLPVDWYPSSIFDLSGVQLNCVSHSQANGRTLPVVTNGIDVGLFRPEGTKQDYLFWLGRICPEKGVHVALQVAHRHNLRLIVAGPVHPLPVHQDYYQREVLPYLDDKRIHVGPVWGTKKRELLCRARCLLVPSTVAETSSLVSMEAISCGTPVVAFRSGALPEVIEEGLSGFLAGSEDELVDAVNKVGQLSPEACRRTALSRFDSRRMASDYFALHSNLISQMAARA